MTVMVDPGLLNEAHRLLDQARMIAEAPAAELSPIGHGHPSGSEPPGGEWTGQGSFITRASTLEAFGLRINAAIASHSDVMLARANSWCAKELRALQHAPARAAETAVEFRVRICNSYEGVPAGVVARKEMTSVTTVRKLRTEDGREARLGSKLKEERR